MVLEKLIELVPAASFTNDLGADSLDVVDLVMTLEDEFDIEIPDEDIEKIHTVGELAHYLEEHIDS